MLTVTPNKIKVVRENNREVDLYVDTIGYMSLIKRKAFLNLSRRNLELIRGKTILLVDQRFMSLWFCRVRDVSKSSSGYLVGLKSLA